MTKTFRTTTEYFYDDKGRIVKTIETVEEFEDNTVPIKTCPGSNVIKEGQVRVDETPYKVSTGKPPFTASFDVEPKSGSLTVKNDEVRITNKTITEIANEVKDLISRDIQRAGDDIFKPRSSY
jgi:hypothetical protein